MNKSEEFNVSRGADMGTLTHEPLANTSSSHLINKLKEQQNAALLQMHVLQQRQLIKMERSVVTSILHVTDAKVQDFVHNQRAYLELSLDKYSQELHHLQQFTNTVETKLENISYGQVKVKKSLRALCTRQDEFTAYMHTCMNKMRNETEKLKQSQSHLMSMINERFTLLEQMQTQKFNEIRNMLQCQNEQLHDRMETTSFVKLKAPDAKSFAHYTYANHKTGHERKPCAYRTPSSSDSTSSSDSSENESEVSVQGKRTKIHAFTGKELWNIWYTRFQGIAKRQHWSSDDKLDVLLLKVQGLASEFVFDQLSSKIRQDYKVLTTALKNRFRKVTNPKLYSKKFDACNQKRNQTAEDYARELKMLYDKAFPQRNMQVRNDDLLRRFLRGLHDMEAQFQVELVKTPTDIDSAVDEVVNFQTVQNMQSKSLRKAEPISDSDHRDKCNRVWNPPCRNVAYTSYEHKIRPESQSDIDSRPKWIDTLKEDLKQMIRREIESTKSSKSVSAMPQRSNKQNWQNRPDNQTQTGYWSNTVYLSLNQQGTDNEDPCLYNPVTHSPQHYSPVTCQPNTELIPKDHCKLTNAKGDVIHSHSTRECNTTWVKTQSEKYSLLMTFCWEEIFYKIKQASTLISYSPKMLWLDTKYHTTSNNQWKWCKRMEH